MSIFDTIIVLLAFFGMAFMIKEASIFDAPRRFLIRIHPFFYNLFSCYFCVGFHSGYIVFILYKLNLFFILWGLASATLCLFANLFIDKLNSSQD